MKKLLFVGMLLVSLTLLALGGSSVVGAAAPPKAPTNCIDCHLPEQRDYDYSRHAVTTRMVREHKMAREHPVTECGPCHSADYILVPDAEKPTTWDQMSTGVTCPLCHYDHTQGEKAGSRPLLTCEQCHSTLARNTALGAPLVYNPQAEVFQGLAPSFLETNSVPNRWKTKGCADCHMPRVGKDRRSHSFGYRLAGSAELSCGQTGCHEAKAEAYTDLARGWQRETDRELRLVKSLLNNKKPLTGSGGENLKHYQIAKYECDMVAGDLSFGVHNIDFTRHLLAEAKRHLALIK